MKNILYISVFTLFSTLAFAQQESQFTNFVHNVQLVNPAYVGIREVPSFTLLHRNQWIGFKGAPVSQVLSFNSPFFNKRVGFGIGVFHRTAGIISNWSGSIAYSYELKINKEASLRLGLQGTVRYLGFDFSDPEVVLRDVNDPSVANGNDANQYVGNFGAGMFFTYKQIFFGASVPSIFPNEIGFNDDEAVVAQEKPHIYAIGGAKLPVASTIHLMPAFLVKYVENAPVDVDVNMSVMFNNEVSVGMSYRLGGSGYGESIDLLLYYQLSSKFGAGLSYDFSISKLSRHNSGSFEALLRYDLKVDRDDLTNPRFF